MTDFPQEPDLVDFGRAARHLRGVIASDQLDAQTYALLALKDKPMTVPTWRRLLVLPFAALALLTLPIFGVVWGVVTFLLGLVVILSTGAKRWSDALFARWLKVVPWYGRTMLRASAWCGHVPEPAKSAVAPAPAPPAPTPEASTPPSPVGLRVVVPHTDGH